MPAIVTDRLRVNRGRDFLDELQNGDSSYYLTIGKQTAWTDDNDPPVPEDSTENRDNIYHADMIGAKKIVSANCSLVVPRYNWVSGTVYSEYRSDDADLLRRRFYVMTSVGDGSYRVYKCLRNYDGAASTSEPTSEATSGTFTTADNYIWKFMYKISAVDADAYLTSAHMPVKDVTSNDGSLQYQVQTGAVAGAINAILMDDNGTGYSSAPTVTIEGDGTGATATATVSGGFVRRINVTAAGTGYTFATVTLTGGGGSGAEASAQIAPPGGHGFNPVQELGGYNVQILVALEEDEDDTLDVNNDYRNIGILRDPYDYGTTDVATDLNIRQTFKYGLNTVTGSFSNDELITQATSGATARVVWHDVTNQDIYINNVVGTFTLGGAQTVTGGTSGSTARFDAALVDSDPGFVIRSGEFCYLENRRPISRASDQTENIKIVIEF